MRTAALVLSAFTGLTPNPAMLRAAPPPSTFDSTFAGPPAQAVLASFETPFEAAAPVGWPDSLLRFSASDAALRAFLAGEPDPLRPEASAEDETAEDLLDTPGTGELTPHFAFSGCELGLGGNPDPASWARELWYGAPRPTITECGHTEKNGQYLTYEQIGRRPGRPEEYALYRTPVVDAPVVSGYDLDRPDDEQRRGHMHAVGHGGIDLMAPMGTPILTVRLEHQIGDAEVLYVGPLYGQTVVTRHTVRENGSDRDYVLLFGHLDRVAEDVRRGRRLREGATLGFVGNSDSPELVHLHLEARRVRDGVDAWRLPGSLMAARESTTVTDPRNVLPLRTPRVRAPRCAPKLAAPARRYWLGDALTLSLDAPPAALD